MCVNYRGMAPGTARRVEANGAAEYGSVRRVLTVRLRDQTGYSGQRSATTVLSVEHTMVPGRARVEHHVPRGPHHQTLTDCGLSLLNSDHYTQSDARILITDYRVLTIPGLPCSTRQLAAVSMGASGLDTNGTFRWSTVQASSVTRQRT